MRQLGARDKRSEVFIILRVGTRKYVCLNLEAYLTYKYDSEKPRQCFHFKRRLKDNASLAQRVWGLLGNGLSRDRYLLVLWSNFIVEIYIPP